MSCACSRPSRAFVLSTNATEQYRYVHAYGLRAGEVGVPWDDLTGKRDAPAAARAGPNASLAAVAGVRHAILQYIREARPRPRASSTSRAPIRRSPGRRWTRWFAIAWRSASSGRRGPRAAACGGRSSGSGVMMGDRGLSGTATVVHRDLRQVNLTAPAKWRPSI